MHLGEFALSERPPVALKAELRPMGSALAERNDNAFGLDYPEGIGRVKADPVRLRQSLYNLL